MPTSSPIATKAQLDSYTRALAKLTGTLSFKVQRLRQSRSDDPIQQLQTEVIVELYEAVRELQDVTAPLWDALLPKGIQDVRDAANQANQGGSSTPLKPLTTLASSQSRAFKRP